MIWETPKPTRDLTYVQDTADGFIEIFNCKELVGNVTNIGMNEEISVEDLANSLAELLGVKITIKEDNKKVTWE